MVLNFKSKNSNSQKSNQELSNLQLHYFNELGISAGYYGDIPKELKADIATPLETKV